MKWRPEECGKITDDTGAFLGRANSDADAGNLCSDHNADIDALTAERDKWQARCKNLVEAMAVHGYSPESLARIAEGIE